ncbi:MAG: glycosyltransferase [Deltaproteobacteria bacterium]|nr:glycosyltransferase [Deltaproteobacteria bacterium]
MRFALLRTSDDFIISELSRSIRLRNHDLKEIHLDTRKQEGDEWVLYDYKRVLKELIEFKPDAALSLNHRGLNDPLGRLARVLALLKIPTLSWHLDSPFWNLDPIRRTDNPYQTIFCFDQAYIQPLKEHLEASSVVYLPNATDPDLFRPAPEAKRDQQDVTFVGSLCLGSFRSLSRKTLDIGEGRLPQLIRFFEEAERKSWDPEEMVVEARKKLSGATESVDRDALCRLADEYRAYRYRAGMIAQVMDFDLTLYGDEDWLELVRPEQFGGRAQYYGDLPGIYGTSAINLNLSRPQVRTGLNQRFFDVPAAEGFLLTDFREDILDLFEEGEEIAVFRSGPELKDMVRRFLGDARRRRQMAGRARRKVLDRHTYVHRVDAISAYLQALRPLLAKMDFFFLQRFWGTDPGFVESCRLLGQVLFSMGDHRGGRFLYERLAEMGVGDGEIRVRLGALASSVGNTKESEEHIRKALELNRDDAAAHSVAAVNAQKQGKPALALRHFRRSIDLGNRDPNVLERAVSLRDQLQVPFPTDSRKPAIAILLESANQPFGGVRVLLEYAHRLAGKKYPVFLLAWQPQYSDWFELGAPVIGPERWDEVLNRVQVAVFSQHRLIGGIPVRDGLRRVFLAQHFFSDPNEETDSERTYRDGSMELIAVSSHVQRAVMERFGRSVRLVHSGIDRRVFHPTPDLRRPTDPLRMLYCYSSHPLKGGASGLETLKRVKSRFPEVRIALFGMGPRPEFDLEFLYYRNPEQDELARLYASSHIFLSTSKEEGFGLTGLEAMACASALVSTRNGGNEDYCWDGENALLCTYGDVSELSGAVERLLEDADLRSRLVECGLETAARFDWEDSVVRFEEMIVKGA